MRKIELEERKKLQIEILDAVVDFCEKHKLRYFLAYGTLLGAIRHKGFIPWDDDIDIAMPRSDYEQFMESFEKESAFLKNVYYKNNFEYAVPFGKVYNPLTKVDEYKYKGDCFGVYVDIFPLDGFVSRFQIVRYWLFQKLLNCKKAALGRNRGLLKDVGLVLGKIVLLPISIRSIVKRIDCIWKEGSFETAEFVESFYTVTFKKIKNPKSVFEDCEYAEFEGKRYRIPKGYDAYLKNQYGNYMELPPVEKRYSHHESEAWWID